MILADSAQISDGKLFLLGAGWDKTTGKAPSAVAVIVEIPRDDSKKSCDLSLELFNAEDGTPFLLETEGGRKPLKIGWKFQIEKVPDSLSFLSFNQSFACAIGPLPDLECGKRYEWRCSIDGIKHDTRSFVVVEGI